MTNQIDLELAKRIVDYLNGLVELDKPAVAALISNRVPCNEGLAHHPTCQVVAQNGGMFVGLLGLLNGLCGINEEGWGPIAASFTVVDKEHPERICDLKGFVITPAVAAENKPDA